VRDYAKVEPKMWHGQTMKALRKCPEGVIVGMYLMTSPQSNMLGLFSQPVLYMAHETGLGIEGAMKGLQHCIAVGFCSFDEESEFVWVHEMARYQIAHELKASDLRCKGIQKDYDSLPDNPFLAPFFDRYAQAFHLTSRRGIKGACEAPTKPLRSQEQEQEQEKEQEKGERRSQATRPPTSRSKSEQTTLTAYLANCKTAGLKPVPDGHAIRRWCEDAGITAEMLQVAWVLFRERYTEGEKGKRKRYVRWDDHFATAVKDNWAGLWFMGDDNRPAWTSKGLTHKAVLDARHAQREVAHVE
jgi:hypothetical protein